MFQIFKDYDVPHATILPLLPILLPRGYRGSPSGGEIEVFKDFTAQSCLHQSIKTLFYLNLALQFLMPCRTEPLAATRASTILLVPLGCRLLFISQLISDWLIRNTRHPEKCNAGHCITSYITKYRLLDVFQINIFKYINLQNIQQSVLSI